MELTDIYVANMGIYKSNDSLYSYVKCMHHYTSPSSYLLNFKKVACLLALYM